MRSLAFRQLPLTLLLWMASSFSAAADESIHGTGQIFTVGQIFYFGYAGIDMKPVQSRLAVHIGEVLREEAFHAERETIRKSIREVTGKTPTDVAVVCCDAGQRLTIYIGMGGNSSRHLATRALPTGADHLDAALKLYEREITANESAVSRGATSEDDSLGYALTNDPETRRIQIEMRAYAIQRGHDLARVLLHGADVKQRQ